MRLQASTCRDLDSRGSRQARSAVRRRLSRAPVPLFSEFTGCSSSRHRFVTSRDEDPPGRTTNGRDLGGQADEAGPVSHRDDDFHRRRMSNLGDAFRSDPGADDPLGARGMATQPAECLGSYPPSCPRLLCSPGASSPESGKNLRPTRWSEQTQLGRLKTAPRLPGHALPERELHRGDCRRCATLELTRG